MQVLCRPPEPLKQPSIVVREAAAHGANREESNVVMRVWNKQSVKCHESNPGRRWKRRVDVVLN